MDKKTIIAIVLATVVLMGSQFLISKYTAKPQPAVITAKQEKTEATQPQKGTPAQTVNPKAAQTAPEDKEIKIETALYSAVMTSKGATLKSFDLKGYKDKKGVVIPLLDPQSAYQPLAIGATPDNFALSNVNFRIKGSDLELKDSQTGSITFEYASPQHTLRRTYSFNANSYKIELKDEVSGLPEYWITLGPDFGVYDRKDDSEHTGPVILKDAERIELKAKKLTEPQTYKDNLRWIAQEDKYFFASLVPSDQVIEARAWKAQDLMLVAFKVKAGTNNFVIYAGPKEYDRLAELKLGLEHIVDFGFFSILARPLFWLLKFFYKYMGNYGWAIVLLTIVTRIPFIPLLNKGQQSMKRMQELQPRLAELKEKYKNDPQKMQKEMMGIYKKHKVNPVGGCLPMVLQIPVFFALYKILQIAIELRGAPFLLWVTDLSGKDPYYVMPVIMGITMLIQQKMTPTSVDPKQNKIMMIMPVIFTFMFLNFASGLVLYWLVNNVLGILQQVQNNMKKAKNDKSLIVK